MGYRMKNQGKSYMDRFADAQEEVIKAGEKERGADIETQKADSPLDMIPIAAAAAGGGAGPLGGTVPAQGGAIPPLLLPASVVPVPPR